MQLVKNKRQSTVFLLVDLRDSAASVVNGKCMASHAISKQETCIVLLTVSDVKKKKSSICKEPKSEYSCSWALQRARCPDGTLGSLNHSSQSKIVLDDYTFPVTCILAW